METVNVWTDYVLVAMESAIAAHELRNFNIAEARSLPSLGKLRVIVRIYGFGVFSNNRAHMVLEQNGTIIQPEKKVQVPGGIIFDIDFWNAVETGNELKGTFLNYLVYACLYNLKGQSDGNIKFVLVDHSCPKQV